MASTNVSLCHSALLLGLLLGTIGLLRVIGLPIVLGVVVVGILWQREFQSLLFASTEKLGNFFRGRT